MRKGRGGEYESTHQEFELMTTGARMEGDGIAPFVPQILSFLVPLVPQIP